MVKNIGKNKWKGIMKEIENLKQAVYEVEFAAHANEKRTEDKYMILYKYLSKFTYSGEMPLYVEVYDNDLDTMIYSQEYIKEGATKGLWLNMPEYLDKKIVSMANLSEREGCLHLEICVSGNAPYAKL